MPIIPVLTPDMPDYSPPSMPVPDISTNANMMRAKLAAQVAQIATDAGSIYNQQMEAQGQIKANRDLIKYASDMEDAKKKVLDAPLTPMPGSSTQIDPETGEGGQQYDSIGYIPKWQTIEGDYKKEVDRLNKEYESKQDAYTRKYFSGRQTRIQVAGFKSITDAKSALYDNAQLSDWRTSMDDIHQRMYRFDPQKPTWSDANIPSYKIADNTVYAEQKALINKTADTFRAQGMKPTVVEPMREKELKKLDADTARSAMDAKPEAWLLANENGTNEWQKTMDEASRDRLNEKAEAKVSKIHAGEAKIQAELKKADEEALGQALNTETLSRPLISSKKNLQGTQAVWYAHLESQEKGAWRDDEGTVTPLRIKALTYPPPAGTQQELNSALTNRRMSSATHQVLSDAVTRATERLEKRGDEVQNRALTRASHELQMALFPPAVQGPDKLDYAANYDHALQDYHTRLLAEGEAKAPAIAHEVRQKFLARNQDLADNNFQVLNNRLGSAKLKVDANGDVDQDSLAAAANSAYTRFNMGTPEKRAAAKRTGTWPKELDDALHLIQEADEAAQLKKLWKDQSRTIKEGGKPQ